MNPLILLASVTLLLAFGDVEAKPNNYNRIRRQLPGVPREFQNINIENYLRNAKAVQFQLKCVIYEGPCDSIGKYLKRNIPVWLKTQCRNCNDDQKVHAGKLINFFQSSYPKEWNDAIKKFAKGTFTDDEIARFESELGVKIEADPAAASGKPDHNALANLAKESIAALKTTKEPLIIEPRATTPSAVVETSTSADPTVIVAASPSSSVVPEIPAVQSEPEATTTAAAL